jgi:flavin reductase (DIM6/NTAB) family NADH-FMN oxidoreductase RutF
MYYDPRQKNHGLPRDPFTSLVVPRPIGWISTIGRSGVVNLAPYSYFNAISSRPPYVLFASGGRKDSQRNAEETGEFVANLATYDLREEVNTTSMEVAAEVSEPELALLEMAPSAAVRPPRVKRCPAALECKYVKTVSIEDEDGRAIPSSIVIGRVVSVYIDDRVIVDGCVDLAAIRPISRLGYMDYAVVDAIFSMDRPAKPAIAD